MSDAAARDKWNGIYTGAAVGEATPCALLRDFAHLLPATGVALDIACGLGGNALFMARRGLATEAMDISEVAVTQLNDYAVAQRLPLRATTADFTVDDLAEESYDVIVVSHYLERALAPAICAALRPGGLLFYQTFVRETVGDNVPKNPQFRLGPNELLVLFAPLRVVYYRDEGRIGDITQGLRNSAQLIAQRR